MSLTATSELSPAPVMAGWSLTSRALLQKSPLYIFSCSSQSVHFPAAPHPWKPRCFQPSWCCSVGPSLNAPSHQPKYQPTSHLLSSFPDISSTCLHGKNCQDYVLATTTAAPCCNWRRMWLLVMGILISCPCCSLQWQATGSSIHHLYLPDG